MLVFSVTYAPTGQISRQSFITIVYLYCPTVTCVFKSAVNYFFKLSLSQHRTHMPTDIGKATNERHSAFFVEPTVTFLSN